jgi:hypothetical protein
MRAPITLKEGMPADEILCRQSNLILAGLASWVNCLAVEPGFEGFSEDNLEFVGGVKLVQGSTNGPKEGKAPFLGHRMHALHEMDLSVILEARRAAGVVAIPDRFGRLSGKQAMEKFECEDGM